MASIKDVAREAGVGVGTVSRAINNTGYVSPATRNGKKMRPFIQKPVIQGLSGNIDF